MRYCFLICLLQLCCNCGYGQVAKFKLPLQGAPGKDFFINYYVDHKENDGIKDSWCGTKTYDGHEGTDFCLRSFKTMDSGVYVYAIADGTVFAAEDGKYDRSKRWESGRHGNYLGILHATRYKTYYAQLMKGSLLVKLGDKVKAGQPIAKVGSSGYSAAPHLHLELKDIQKQNEIVDPFKGKCGNKKHSLWETEPAYDTNRYAIDNGFVPYKIDAIPYYDTLKERWQVRDSFYTARDSIVAFWVQLSGVKKDDITRAEWLTPKGTKYFEYGDKVLNDDWYTYRWAYIQTPTTKGKWTMKFYVNDELVATRNFYIIKPGKS